LPLNFLFNVGSANNSSFNVGNSAGVFGNNNTNLNTSTNSANETSVKKKIFFSNFFYFIFFKKNRKNESVPSEQMEVESLETLGNSDNQTNTFPVSTVKKKRK
jgi:hypothetical protein